MEQAIKAAVEQEFWGTPPASPRGGDLTLLDGDMLKQAGLLPVAMPQPRKPMLLNLLDLPPPPAVAWEDWQAAAEDPYEAWQVAQMRRCIEAFEGANAARRRRRLLEEWRRVASGPSSSRRLGDRAARETSDAATQAETPPPREGGAACSAADATPPAHAKLQHEPEDPASAQCVPTLSAISYATPRKHAHFASTADSARPPPPFDHPPVLPSPVQKGKRVALSAAGDFLPLKSRQSPPVAAAERAAGFASTALPAEGSACSPLGSLDTLGSAAAEGDTKFYVSHKSTLFAVSHRRSTSNQEGLCGAGADGGAAGDRAGDGGHAEHPECAVTSSPRRGPPKGAAAHLVEVPVQVVQQLPVPLEVVGRRSPAAAPRGAGGRPRGPCAEYPQPLASQARVGVQLAAAAHDRRHVVLQCP